ncbi:hypothetical protein [Vreelandella aquamarina]|uniref:Hypervirulence associated protein TUDOR domain-containing protein n=1 Tax=Vreelandella aquamarina TaxID=77097 RepID=A0A857GLC1_9GAMM|nr:hypothetical protein [Halomonas meridiana]QHD50005.1 hypothetical protein CTT34_10040 [Halomonas meridiana]
MASKIGDEVIYDYELKTTGEKRSVTGKITAIEDGHVIRDIHTGERWPGFRLRIKPNDGSRAIWTTTMKQVN